MATAIKTSEKVIVELSVEGVALGLSEGRTRPHRQNLRGKVHRIGRQGVSQYMQVERKNYPDLGAPVGAYVHAVSYNGLLFLSGLTAFNTSAQDKDLAAQAEVICDQMKSILATEGVGFNNLLKVTIFVTDLEEIDQLRSVLFSTYENNLPASSLVQVKSLFAPELKIEIEAVVALPDS